MSEAKTIQIEIPPDTEPGDSLTFQVDGVEMEILIPQGSTAGEILEIMIASDSPASDEEYDEEVVECHQEPSENVTILSLDKSISENLVIHHQLPPNVCTSYHVTPEKESQSYDGTCAMTWAAGLTLATFVSSPSFRERMGNPSVCVELGSGTGIVALAYAVSCRKSLMLHDDHKDRDATTGSANKKMKRDDLAFQKKRIIITDLEPALPLIKFNIDNAIQQFDIGIQRDIDIEAAALSWGETLSSYRNVNLILASDILYNTKTDVYLSLRKTIDAMNSDGNAKIVIAVRWRKPEEERKFFQIMNDIGYEFDLLHGLKETCSLGWRDFGNPCCHASNVFFSETNICVNGELKALKDVVEEDEDIMNNEEYKTFEKMFVQIYVGQKLTCK